MEWWVGYELSGSDTSSIPNVWQLRLDGKDCFAVSWLIGHEEYADAILRGDKTFEIRYNDRNYQKDDLIVFRTITDFADSPRNCRYFSLDNHPLNKMIFKITYVLSGWGLKEDWVALAIKEVKGDKK